MTLIHNQEVRHGGSILKLLAELQRQDVGETRPVEIGEHVLADNFIEIYIDLPSLNFKAEQLPSSLKEAHNVYHETQIGTGRCPCVHQANETSDPCSCTGAGRLGSPIQRPKKAPLASILTPN